jgi:hypothetical protein
MHNTEVAGDQSRRTDTVGLLFLHSGLVLPCRFIVDKFINSGETKHNAGAMSLLLAAWRRIPPRTRRGNWERPTRGLTSATVPSSFRIEVRKPALRLITENSHFGPVGYGRGEPAHQTAE